jgi:hypothetical protein
MTAISEEAYYRLAQYWGRAQIMRGLMHNLIDEHGGDIQQVMDEGYGLRLETYMSFWMAALFVSVEGFNKLKIKDADVQKLFNAHVGELKELRHITYHFSLSNEEGRHAISAINWAEELHVAIGTHLEKHVDMRGIDR